jgi:hypothetical protein
MQTRGGNAIVDSVGSLIAWNQFENDYPYVSSVTLSTIGDYQTPPILCGFIPGPRYMNFRFFPIIGLGKGKIPI